MSEVDNKVKMIVEGLLLAAGRPLTMDAIMQVFSKEERPDRKELKAVLDAIAEECNDRGFELIEVASGYRFQVKKELSEWVSKLWEEKPPRYTRALLETLALIAYRQPITRGDIEEIRGVAVSTNIIRTLLDREWIRVVGHRDVPGRPAMFATTRQFLDYFNLKSLEQLPPLAEVKELDKSDPKMDLEDDLANQRILDLPPEDDEDLELSAEAQAEMLAEAEAVELSKKPLDEILLHDPVYGKAAREAEEAARRALEEKDEDAPFDADDDAIAGRDGEAKATDQQEAEDAAEFAADDDESADDTIHFAEEDEDEDVDDEDSWSDVSDDLDIRRQDADMSGMDLADESDFGEDFGPASESFTYADEEEVEFEIEADDATDADPVSDAESESESESESDKNARAAALNRDNPGDPAA